MLVLHGIYGQGRNWGSVARRVAQERPDWGVALVDLRMHGASQGFSPPHTVRAAATDLGMLRDALGGDPAVVLGHSFGGKVALAYAEPAPAGLRQVWLLDSTPAPRPPGGSAWEMLRILRSLPAVFGTRAELIGALERGGVAPPIAQWMATNLEHGSDGYRWRFDLDALEALLRDFFAVDLWHVVESPPGGMEVHLVKASESSVLEGAALERARQAAQSGRTFVHIVSGGHWLNADNPDAVVDLLVSQLPG
jgi:pimeloyl-ACP methyl ester carboxylesterase